jgi:Fe-S cluster assembly protein SufD
MNAPLSPLELFRAKGIPNRRMEDWKYTDLRGTLDGASVESIAGAAIHLVLPPPAESMGLTTELPEWAEQEMRSNVSSSAMDAAARAFARRDAILRVPRGEHVNEPLELEFTSAGHARVVLFVEEDASLTLLESHRVSDGGLLNISFAIYLGEGARLTHVRLTPLARDLVTVETISAALEGNSRYVAHLVQGGGKLSRTEIGVKMVGEGASTEFSGACILTDGAHADVTTHVDHAVGNTTSRQLFKHIVAGHSRAVYQGKVTVREDAVGSDSNQTAKALLLSDRAEADLKPELEILADDVKCAHGAAVGDLDADSLFYLRSRGISESDARTMLVRAFLEEAVDRIEDQTLRAQAWQFVERGLAEAMKASL